MKLGSACIVWIVVLFCVTLAGCGPAVELESLERYAGKYSAINRFQFDTKHSSIKPHGIYIEKQGDDYFLSLWHDAIDGEVRKEKQKLLVRQDPATMKPLDFTTESELIRLQLERGGPIFSISKSSYIHELQYSYFFAYRKWRTSRFEPAHLELTDIDRILKEINEGKEVLGKRIKWDGRIEEVVLSTQKDQQHLYFIRLAPVNGVVVNLKHIFHERTSYAEGLLPSFAPVAVGRNVFYKGIVAGVGQDEQGNTVLELESVYYEVEDNRVSNRTVAGLVE